jgi:hypothetical protein
MNYYLHRSEPTLIGSILVRARDYNDIAFVMKFATYRDEQRCREITVRTHCVTEMLCLKTNLIPYDIEREGEYDEYDKF